MYSISKRKRKKERKEKEWRLVTEGACEREIADLSVGKKDSIRARRVERIGPDVRGKREGGGGIVWKPRWKPSQSGAEEQEIRTEVNKA